MRNISASGITSSDLNKVLFGTIEHYGKIGDILLLAVGINDYTKAYSANPAAPDPSSYIENMTDMVQRAKAMGMTVYLVKQHGRSTTLENIRFQRADGSAMQLMRLQKQNKLLCLICARAVCILLTP